MAVDRAEATVRCPACDTEITIPLTMSHTGRATAVVGFDMTPVRAHVAEHDDDSPKRSAMSETLANEKLAMAMATTGDPRTLLVFDPDCQHELLRLPIVEFRIDYQCRKCHGLHSISPHRYWEMTYEEFDRLAEREAGGRVIGEKHFPGSTEETP